MPYQNNNERITPDAVINRKINPVATPVDKLIRYTPDTSKSTEFSNIAESLAALGQGLDTLDERFQKAAADDALSAYENTEGEENKKQWAEVSKNVQGMAKFNPYVKDGYKKLVADDIVKKAVLDLNSDPNFYKADEATFTQRVSDVQTSVLSEFKNTGLEAKDYADSLEKFRKSMSEHTLNYVKKNNEYNYNLSLNKKAFDYGHTVSTGLYGVTDENTKTDTILAITNANVERLTALGIPKDDICKIISSGLVDYIIRDPESVNEEALKAALNKVTVQGSKLGELDPELEYKLHKLITSAKREKREQRYNEYQDKKLKQTMTDEEASNEFFTWLKNNKNASDKAAMAKGWEIIDKYGIESTDSVLGTIVTTQGRLRQIMSAKSDPDVLQKFALKNALGELTRAEVIAAGSNGTLSADDVTKFCNMLEKHEEKIKKADTKRAYSIGKNLMAELKQQYNFVKNKPLSTDKTFYEDMMVQVNELNTDLVNELLTPQEYCDRINGIIERSRGNQVPKEFSNFKPINLVQRAYRNRFTPATSDRDRALQTLKDCNIVDDCIITSMPSYDRGGSPHYGIDFISGNGDCNGKPIRAGMAGQILYAGYEGSMGNWAIVRFANGNYAVYNHLQDNIVGKISEELRPGSMVGRIGHTGHTDPEGSAGAHVHIECYDSNGNPISIENCFKDVKNPKYSFDNVKTSTKEAIREFKEWDKKSKINIPTAFIGYDENINPIYKE